MKILKSLLSMFIVFAIMASMLVSVSADSAISADAQICKDLNILKGSAGVDAAYLSKNTQRLQAAILTLRLLGKEAQALSFAGKTNFIDAKNVSWSAGKNVMAFLKENPDFGWAGGNDGTFNPNGETIPAHIYKVILELLGYRQGADFIWSEVMSFAESKGLKKLKNAKALMNEWMAVALVEGLKAKTSAGNETLIEKLVRTSIIKEADAIKVGLISIKVVAATIANNTQISVKFSKPIYKDPSPTISTLSLGANNTANYGIEGITPISAEIQSDGLTVLLTFPSTVSGTNKVFTVKSVASAASLSELSEIYSMPYSYADTEAPRYVSTQYTAYGKADITFSEPMLSLGVITVTQNGTEKNLTSSPIWNASNTVLSVDISGSDFADSTPISIVFVGAKDKAGNFIYPNPTPVTLTKTKSETVAPSVVSMTANSNRLITIVFSEKLSNTPSIVAGNVSSPSSVILSTADYITFTGLLSSSFTGIGKIIVADGYKDMNNNTGVGVTSAFLTFAADTTAPALTSYAVEVINNVPYLVLKYNENVVPNSSSSMTGTTRVSNSITFSGETIPLPSPILYVNGSVTDPNAVMINISALVVGSYSGTLGANVVKDSSNNLSAASNIAFARGTVSGVADTIAPTVSNLFPPVFSSNNSTFTVVFSENMDPTTALSAANYKINGVSIFSSAIFDSNAYTVKLTVIPSTILFNGIYTINISGVKDAAGNTMTTYAPADGINARENVKPTIVSAALVTSNSVTVTFSENVTISANAFEYAIAGAVTAGATNSAVTAKTITVNIPTLSADNLAKTLTLKLIGNAADANGNVATTNAPVTIAK